MTTNRFTVLMGVGLAFAATWGCAKPAEPAADAASQEEQNAESAQPLRPVEENTTRQFVEGVAGGVMISTIKLQAEVVSVDQEKREAVLRGPEGNEVVVRVGENAVNFYQVKAGDRVNVTMARELVVYVPDEPEDQADGTVVAGAGAEKGDTPAGAVVATSKITATIVALDAEHRKATLSFGQDGEQTFEVRPDVDMTKYSVGQDVVFLITDFLAMQVEAL